MLCRPVAPLMRQPVYAGWQESRFFNLRLPIHGGQPVTNRRLKTCFPTIRSRTRPVAMSLFCHTITCYGITCALVPPNLPPIITAPDKSHTNVGAWPGHGCVAAYRAIPLKHDLFFDFAIVADDIYSRGNSCQSLSLA